MKVATCELRSETPITFGKFHQTEKLPGELAGAYEERTWKEKLHINAQNDIVIPGTMFGNCIRESAKFMSLQIAGKGKATYTKHFDAGIIVQNDIVLPDKREDIQGLAVFVPSDGRPGGTSRVIKIFPRVDKWHGLISFIIGDDIITADVFEKVLRNAGSLIGIGTWRPRNRGMNGRFQLLDMEWVDK